MRLSASQVVVLAGALAALVWAVGVSAGLAWTCDDAFISFRYADNLVRGQGLVFNPGERVEGYTNFLWTLLMALGLRLGAAAETWSKVLGVCCYGATILLLAVDHLRLRRVLQLDGPTERTPAPLTLPTAAILAAALVDWNTWATGGLETACFTLLATAGYLAAIRQPDSWRWAAAAGALLGLCALTRPDGILFAVVVGAWQLLRRDRSLKVTAAYAAAFLLLTAPFLLWRLAYYGDLLPNTYYAKSAGQSWYAQGWIYARLFFGTNWPLLLALALPLVHLLARRELAPERRPALDRALFEEGTLALALALTYSWYVIRVGGDFMYARLLIPTLPFWLVALERGLLATAAWRRWLPLLGTTLVTLALLVLTPRPFVGIVGPAGVADEWLYYNTPPLPVEADNQGRTLRRFFSGLKVRVMFVGSQARLVYQSRPAVAIESITGLTDRFVARQPLPGGKRGRPGHEKHAPLSYVVGRRKAQLVFALHNPVVERLHLQGRIPVVPIRLGPVPGFVLHWDPALMATLRRRGAEVEDFPRRLDRYLAQMARLPDARVRADFAGFKLFYFDHVDDPRRRRAFTTRLSQAQ
jgi:hypothetical protein